MVEWNTPDGPDEHAEGPDVPDDGDVRMMKGGYVI